MSSQAEPTLEGQPDDAEGVRAERSVEARAEEIVERVSEEVTRFARRLVARAREEVEDVVAEAQSVRRGDRPRD
jgi:hypothetical protein